MLEKGKKARDLVKCTRSFANIEPANNNAFVMVISDSAKEQAYPSCYGLQAGRPLPTK